MLMQTGKPCAGTPSRRQRHIINVNKPGTAKVGAPLKAEKEQKYFKASKNLFRKNSQSHNAKKLQRAFGPNRLLSRRKTKKPQLFPCFMKRNKKPGGNIVPKSRKVPKSTNGILLGYWIFLRKSCTVPKITLILSQSKYL